MCRTQMKIYERVRRRRNGSNGRSGSWAYDEQSYDCHPERDGELSNYLLITADRILLRVSLLFFISDVRRGTDVTRN